MGKKAERPIGNSVKMEISVQLFLKVKSRGTLSMSGSVCVARHFGDI